MRVKMQTPNGGAEIEVDEDQVAQLEAQGYQRVKDEPVKPARYARKTETPAEE